MEQKPHPPSHMAFRYFSPLFGAVALPSWASFCELYDVSVQVSKELTTNYITYHISYTILFSRSQSSHPVCWMPLDAQWSHCFYLLGSLSPLWHRCVYDSSHYAIRNVLKSCLQVMLILMAIPAWRVWELVSNVDSSLQFLRDNSDRSRLTKVVHRDGESGLQALLLFFSK